MKKLFGGIDLSWKKLIFCAVVAGVYTGIAALLPLFKGTSFADISISFERWVLFGVLIILNSRSNLDAALKCFVFFLISQPLVYLVQVPFHPDGWSLFRYYPGWFVWTLLTFPMGYVGYYLKKDKWWGLGILVPVMVFVGIHYEGFLRETLSRFPLRFVSTLFCAVTVILYPLAVFRTKKLRIIGACAGAAILLVFSGLALSKGPAVYRSIVLSSEGSLGAVFDDSCSVRLEDPSLGEVSVVYEEDLKDYVVQGEFTGLGTTRLILEYPDGTSISFRLSIGDSTYLIELEDP